MFVILGLLFLFITIFICINYYKKNLPIHDHNHSISSARGIATIIFIISFVIICLALGKGIYNSFPYRFVYDFISALLPQLKSYPDLESIFIKIHKPVSILIPGFVYVYFSVFIVNSIIENLKISKK